MARSLVITALLLLTLTAQAADLGAGVRAIKDHDFPKAFEEIHPLAEQGNPEAQDWLAWMYLSGNGVSKDYAEAKRWFSESASKGYAKAEFHLGLFVYANGWGAKQDWSKARMWYGKAAGHGYAEADYQLGLLNYAGLGAPKSYIKALDWFRLGAAKGNPESMYKLSTMYADGVGIDRDDLAAYALLTFPGISKDSVPTGLVDDSYRSLLLGRMTDENVREGDVLALEIERLGLIEALHAHDALRKKNQKS